VKHRLLVTAVMALALGARPAVAGLGLIDPIGLQGRNVTSLGIFGSLYAGTIGDGVFKRDLQDPFADWVSLGLQGSTIRAVYPHQSGPLGIATTVGLQSSPWHRDSSLIYCSESDQPPWVPTDSGMVRVDVAAVFSLDGFPSPAICGETFAASVGSSGGVWRRRFDSTQWEFVLDVGFGVGNVVRADAASGNVWAGGENAMMAPWIARSTDQGNTWHIVYPDLAGDNACNSIAVHPDDPDIAYAGMEGPVLKTEDGGVTWIPTGLGSTQAYIYGVALDSGAPSHLLAGGMARPNNWALWESSNAGLTWTEIPPPSPGVTGISSILADPLRRGTFYLGTFGHGVWRYENPSTGIEKPIPFTGVLLRQNVPNPFTTQTTLVYEVPAAEARAHVHLAIYSVRGDRVRVLVDEPRVMGPQSITWNGVDANGRTVEPGIYYARMRVGSHVQTRRISVLK
jgi:hypothetical protein